MTPPEATRAGQDCQAGETQPAVFSRAVTSLRKRSDFLRASGAGRVASGTFLLQARRRNPADGIDGIRLGITCSRKVGNAVLRNRAKRRLREIARRVLPTHGRPGWDYVLVGRPGQTAAAPFAGMVEAFQAALARVHAAEPRP